MATTWQAAIEGCRIETSRLELRRLRSATAIDGLPARLIEILSAEVTATLPPGWQDITTVERAEAWLNARLQEGEVLAVLTRGNGEAIGLLLLHVDDGPDGPEPYDVRIGYLLARAWWGQGLATELISGFADWCRAMGVVGRIIGVVERGNRASARVLERTGFVPLAATASTTADDTADNTMTNFVLELGVAPSTDRQ